MKLAMRSVFAGIFIAGFAGSVFAQSFTDIGSTAPTPGTNDIYQLSTQGNQTWPDEINYFTDNNPPVGQTFTTGTNPVSLASIATQNFSVVMNPLSAPGIGNVSAVDGQFSFSITGQSGPDYAVESSTNLTQWSTVFITNSPTLPFLWTEANSGALQRFYRVKLGPPLP